MTRRRRTLLLGAVVLLVVAVVAVVVVRRVTADDGTRLQQAVALAPNDAQRLTWTDWAGVRAELGTDNLDRLLDEGFSADLTSTSALVGSAPTLQQRYGFSPQSLEWELFSQGTDAAVVLMGLADGAADTVADRLRDLGYTEPDDATGVWLGSNDLLAKIGEVTPELTYLSLDEDRDLMLGSDTEAGVERALDELDDDAEPDVAEVAEAVGSPLSAAVYTGDQTCNALAMAGADPADQAAAAELVAEAGEIDPVTGFAIGERRGGDLRGRVVVRDRGPGPRQRRQPRRAGGRSGPGAGRRLRRPVHPRRRPRRRTRRDFGARAARRRLRALRPQQRAGAVRHLLTAVGVGGWIRGRGRRRARRRG